MAFATSCKTDEQPFNDGVTGTVTDIDGNVYKTVTIGSQTWMVENLRTTKYQNDEPINVRYSGTDTVITNIDLIAIKRDTIIIKYDGTNVTLKSKDKNFKTNLNGDKIYAKGDTIAVSFLLDTTYVKNRIETIKIPRKSASIDISVNSVWATYSNGIQCTYNLTANADSIVKFGRLYNYSAVVDVRKIAPIGWHVPTKDEFTTLQSYVNSHLGKSGNIAKALAATIDWTTSTNTDAIGNDLLKNNVSAFTALPGGYRGVSGSFVGLGVSGQWWSISAGPSVGASWYTGFLNYFNDAINSTYNTQYGLSVRCIKD